jgi:hypothetical protein
MKSPFPGMDPYIEAAGLWEDFHHNLITDVQRSLARVAPSRYLVRTGERSYLVLVEENGKDTHPFLPDVSITTPRTRKKGAKKASGTAVIASVPDSETMLMRAFIAEEHRETFVEIYEATPEQRLVTSIEILSPTNKRPNTPGRELYLRKRQSHLLGEANLVEIDLLRGGERMPMLDAWPSSPYTLLVARAGKPQLCRVWPAFFDSALPTIAVPLLKPDPELPLSLQPLVEGIYALSRYAQSIDYHKPLSPPLKTEMQNWLQEQLRSQEGRR